MFSDQLFDKGIYASSAIETKIYKFIYNIDQEQIHGRAGFSTSIGRLFHIVGYLKNVPY